MSRKEQIIVTEGHLSNPDREPKPHIRAAIFDSGGVLSKETFVDIRDDISQTLKLTTEEVTQAWRRVYPLHGAGEIDETEFWQRFQKEAGLSSLNLPPGESLLVRAHHAKYEPYPEVLDIIKKLKNQGLRIALLSNSWPALQKFEDERGTFADFDEVYYSHRIKKRKPDLEAFQHVLTSFKKSAIEPHEIIFVDDKLPNVEAAKNPRHTRSLVPRSNPTNKRSRKLWPPSDINPTFLCLYSYTDP